MEREKGKREREREIKGGDNDAEAGPDDPH